MSNRPPFKQAFTFDDVLLVPQKSSVLPRDVNLKTRLTNKIELNIKKNSINSLKILFDFILTTSKTNN